MVLGEPLRRGFVLEAGNTSCSFWALALTRLKGLNSRQFKHYYLRETTWNPKIPHPRSQCHLGSLTMTSSDICLVSCSQNLLSQKWAFASSSFLTELRLPQGRRSPLYFGRSTTNRSTLLFSQLSALKWPKKQLHQMFPGKECCHGTIYLRYCFFADFICRRLYLLISKAVNPSRGHPRRYPRTLPPSRNGTKSSMMEPARPVLSIPIAAEPRNKPL